MSPVFKQRHSILYRNKERSYELVGFDNTLVKGNNGRVTEETRELEITVETYMEFMKFDIIETSIYNATFGLLWLEKHKPDIVYKARTIQFKKYSYNLGISAVEIFSIFLAAMAVY
jgi:hypothetical protein